MPPRELLKTPMRMFWMLSNNIPRIEAQLSQRQFNIAVMSQSEKGQEFVDALSEQVGEVVRMAPAVKTVDGRAGFARLRQLSEGRLGIVKTKKQE